MAFEKSVYLALKGLAMEKIVEKGVRDIVCGNCGNSFTVSGTFTTFRDCRALFTPDEAIICPCCGLHIIPRKKCCTSVENAYSALKMRIYDKASFVPYLEFKGDKIIINEYLKHDKTEQVAARLIINQLDAPSSPGELISENSSYTPVFELFFYNYKSVDVVIYELEKLREYLKENSSKNEENTNMNTD